MLDDRLRTAIRAEEADWERIAEPELSVLALAEVETLRGKSQETIGAVLAVCVTFPGARVLERVARERRGPECVAAAELLEDEAGSRSM